MDRDSNCVPRMQIVCSSAEMSHSRESVFSSTSKWIQQKLFYLLSHDFLLRNLPASLTQLVTT
jgi:hypothetical protein